MTTFGDVVQTGTVALTSGLSSIMPALYHRTFRFTGTGTQTFVFPVGVQCLDAKLWIEANGSAATTDKITVSAGGVDLITITSFGSTAGVLRQTTAAVGTITNIASATASVSPTVEVTAAATLLSVDQAAVYTLHLQGGLLRDTDI